MGVWSKIALLAAGALVGGAATRVASDPAAREAVARQISRVPVEGTPSSADLARRAGADVERRPGGGPVELLREGARRLRDFSARVRAGMDEREAELREQFGVRAPVDHSANHPGDVANHPGDGPGHSGDAAGAPWRPVAPHDPEAGPGQLPHRIIDHDPSEGNER